MSPPIRGKIVLVLTTKVNKVVKTLKHVVFIQIMDQSPDNGLGGVFDILAFRCFVNFRSPVVG